MVIRASPPPHLPPVSDTLWSCNDFVWPTFMLHVTVNINLLLKRNIAVTYNVNFFLLSFHRKRGLVQVPGHLTDDIEQLAEIVKGRGKEIVSGEVRDTGTHWNVREKESGTEKENVRDIG